MILFSYRGLDTQGAEVRGTVEATDKDDALKKLKALQAQGLHDLLIEGAQQQNGGAQAVVRFCGSCGHKNSAEDRFCMSCGKPLVETAQGQATLTKQNRQPSELPPLWIRVVFLLFSLWMISYLWTMAFPKSAPRPSESPGVKAAKQRENDLRLQEIIHDKYGQDGVLRVQVSGPVMDVHVVPETYRLLFSNRVEGNKVMRGWQNLLAQNDDNSHGIGSVRLFSEGQKVAEADKNVWSGEVKVRWFDE